MPEVKTNKKVTLNELPKITNLNANDLLLVRQHLTDKTTTPEQIKQYLKNELVSKGEFGIGGKCKTFSGNWNDVKETGCYMSSQATNSPLSGGRWVYVIHLQHDELYAQQLAYPVSSVHGEHVWMRNKTAGNWSSWERFYTTLNKPTPEEIGAASNKNPTVNSGVAISNSLYPYLKLISKNLRTDDYLSSVILEPNASGSLNFIYRRSDGKMDGQKVITLPAITGTIYTTGNKPTPEEIGALKKDMKTYHNGYLLTKSANYNEDSTAKNLSYSGFFRTNNNDGFAGLMIHVAHPNYPGGPNFARGITFEYGNHALHRLYTYSFNEKGEYRDKSRIYTEADKPTPDELDIYSKTESNTRFQSKQRIDTVIWSGRIGHGGMMNMSKNILGKTIFLRFAEWEIVGSYIPIQLPATIGVSLYIAVPNNNFIILKIENEKTLQLAVSKIAFDQVLLTE